MALQKKIRNDRYKVFTKQWLIDHNVEIRLDGVATSSIPTKALKMFFYDYKTIEIQQFSFKYNKWYTKKPIPNKVPHPKGIIGECTYYQVPITIDGHGTSIPLHRIVYVWFNDIIEPYNEDNEKMEICHIDGDSSNNHILNLTYDTAKNNRAQRKGAINQYGYRKEKYGYEALTDETSQLRKDS